MRRVQQWWEESSYLEDVASVFTVITVANSTMMIAGWDTPKTGTFAYVHLLSRLAIVAAIITLFHLDDIKNLVERWRIGDGSRPAPTPERSMGDRAVGLLRQQMPHAPLEGIAVAFTAVTGLVCLTAITSSVWREPQGGVALYQVLLGLAATLALLIGGWAWWHRGAR